MNMRLPGYLHLLCCPEETILQFVDATGFWEPHLEEEYWSVVSWRPLQPKDMSCYEQIKPGCGLDTSVASPHTFLNFNPFIPLAGYQVIQID